MAIKATVTTAFGETKELYIRLNNIDANNHGEPARALFRGYAMQEAFQSGAMYLWEQSIELAADISLPLWDQAYDALKAMSEFTDAVDC